MMLIASRGSVKKNLHLVQPKNNSSFMFAYVNMYANNVGSHKI